jgi:hypothetical protein
VQMKRIRNTSFLQVGEQAPIVQDVRETGKGAGYEKMPLPKGVGRGQGINQNHFPTTN